MSSISGSENSQDGLSKPQIAVTKDASPIFLTFLYVCCFLVTLTYVNFYALYTFLRERLGGGFIIWSPIATTLVLLLVLLYVFVRRRKKTVVNMSWVLVAAGVVLAIVALFIPDPSLGAKRIHVTEYVLLSLLVRYTLAQRHSGNYLFVVSILLTVLCGIHDEFLQGLHPQRTYGLRDIAVNSVSALAGGCVWQGLGLFKSGQKGGINSTPNLIWPALYLLCLSVTVFLAILPIPAYMRTEMPLWVFLPLAASLVYCSCFLPTFAHTFRHGAWAVSGAAFLLFIYPVMTNVFQVTFF